MAELYSCSILGKTVPSSINAEKIMHLLNRHKLKIFTKTYLSPKFSKYFQAVNRQKACDQVPRTKSDGRPPCVNTSFCREADENCALLGYYTASSGNSLPTFRDKLPVPSSWVKNPGLLPKIREDISLPFSRNTLEDGTEMYRNVGKKLLLLAA